MGRHSDILGMQPLWVTFWLGVWLNCEIQLNRNHVYDF